MPLHGRKVVKVQGEFYVNTNEDKKVDLQSFADMAGFPIELIRKELFEKDPSTQNEVSLEKLRAAMLSYLDSAMLLED